ncbi:MAG: beta-phosphoglucomutase [Planctomycetes bacterium GWF2_42_9]|nr:MAG: beta-phosphoglucomutase [Planctomycetes bacterium GWF2_42_9]
MNKLFIVAPWEIIEDQFRPEKNKISESIFSLANEYMGVRGMYEEGLSSDSLDGSYISGIYIKEAQVYGWKRIGFPDYSCCKVNTTNWIKIQIHVGDEAFSMDASSFNGYRRTLDMKNGILKRELVFETRNGNKTKLYWERVVSFSDEHIGAVRLCLEALNHSEVISLSFYLDSTKENQECFNREVHCCEIVKKADEEEMFLLMNVVSTGQFYIHRMAIDTHGTKLLKEKYLAENRRIGYSVTFQAEQNKSYVFDKIVSVWTNRDCGYPWGLIAKESAATAVPIEKIKEVSDYLLHESKRSLANYNDSAYEIIRNDHKKILESLWQNIDVQIEGDPLTQQGIRFCIFQLINAYRGQDSYLSVSPKGYTGEHYWGRVFWDSESYCLPFYLFTNPAAARNLIEYRYRTLDLARQRAKVFNYDGCMYPMTTIDGSEDLNYWEYSVCEVHINSTIAYAAFVYEHVTGDTDYLYDKGVELVIEVARFWYSRGTFIPFRNGFGINFVIGADEWQQFVNNNFYTNYMAKWVLGYAAKITAEMKADAPQKWEALKTKINFKEGESAEWLKASDKMLLNYNAEMDVFIQDDSFLSQDPYYREWLELEKDIPVERKWAIDKYLKRQVLKQPDILLAMFLFRDRFTLEQKKNNYRFYEQRTAHGSSLSPCIHSILASEIGRYHQAYEYFNYASRLDLDNLNNNTEEGLHISSLAGTWLNIVCGFGGMNYSGKTLEFAPILPSQWQSYSFKISYFGSTIEITRGKEYITYRLINGHNVVCRIFENDVTVTSEMKTLKVPLLPQDHFAAVLFDLDGVITDTARYHYLAWKKIADGEGIEFDETINERLRGVSREESIKIIVERSQKQYSKEQLDKLATLKNNLYVEMLQSLTPADVLPGIREFLDILKTKGIKIGLVSASKNAEFVLEELNMKKDFEIIVTGNHTTKSKPDPEAVLLACQKLNLQPCNCVLVEDAFAGIASGKNAGMRTVGIGDKTQLHNADHVLSSTRYLTYDILWRLF